VTPDNVMLSVTKGDASAADIAALIALFSVMGNSATSEGNPDEIQSWDNKEQILRSFPIPGAGAWWSSGLPQ